MKKKAGILILVIALVGLIWLFMPPLGDSNIKTGLTPNLENGLLMLQAGGCLACHTKDEEYGGQLKLDSPFGDFLSPNITMNKANGLGNWSLGDFARAVRQGISPDGEYYYPVMPFTSYQGLTDQDVTDMWYALKGIPESTQANLEHELGFPFNQRVLLKGWRLLFFSSNQVPPENRGEYLAEHVLHCSECHTPRNLMGGLILSKHYQGNDLLPDDNVAPAITPDDLVEYGWTDEDLDFMLSIGMLPDGDFIGGSMAEVVEFGSSKLSDGDRADLVNYLLQN